MRTIERLLVAASVVAALAAPAAAAEEDIPAVPDERTVVLRLLDALAVGGEPLARRAREQLKRHAKLAGPLLRERLERPDLPNWVFSLDTLAELAPDEVAKLEAGLGKDKPDLSVRFHLWKLAQPKKEKNESWPLPWAEWEPFNEGRIKESASLAAIAGFGERAVPELARSLGDPRLRLPATYAVGALKVTRLAADLAGAIGQTRLYAGGGRGGPPPRTFSLAAAALVRLGEEGQRVLLEKLGQSRFTVEPNLVKPELQQTADLIVEAFVHARAKADLGKALSRLLDSEDEAVRVWALKTLIAVCRTELGDPDYPKQDLPTPMAKLIALMGENEKGGNTPSELARVAAEFLGKRLGDPVACDACLSQFEKGRFLDILLKGWAGGENDSRRYDAFRAADGFAFPDAHGRLKRLALAIIQGKVDPRLSLVDERLGVVRLFGRLSIAWDTKLRDAADLAVLRRFALAETEGWEGVRAEAALYVARHADLGRAAEAFDILAEAIEQELKLPKQEKSEEWGRALLNMVQGLPFACWKDPVPVLEKVARAPLSESLRNEAKARLAVTGDLRAADTLLAEPRAWHEGAPASLYLGFHLLPRAVELMNSDQGAVGRAALRAIADLAAYPDAHRQYYRTWRGVDPDEESAALARLAARHVGPGVVRLVVRVTDESRYLSYDLQTALRVLKVPEAVPKLVWKAAFGIPGTGDTLAEFELSPKDYDILFDVARGKKLEALKAISGTANPKAAALWDTWKELGPHSLWLARSLLRIGDERGIDLCLQIATQERGVDLAEQERAARAIGLCRTPKAAERLVGYLASTRYPRKGAFEALEEIGRPAVPAILRALADPAWAPARWGDDVAQLRASLIESLGKIGDGRAVPFLASIAAKKEYGEPQAAFTALCAIPTPEARAAVLDLVRRGARLDWDRWGRLSKLVEKDPEAGEFFAELAERCFDQKLDDWCRDAAALAAKLTRNPEATRERLYKLFARPAPSPSLRGGLRSALIQLGDRRVQPPAAPPPKPLDPAQEALLRKRLDSPDLDERFKAAEELARRKARGIVQELLARTNRSLSEHAVVRALGAHGSDEAADALRDLATDPTRLPGLTGDTRWWALRTLREIGSPRALAACKAILYGDLVGSNARLSRTALASLAEADKAALRAKLLDLAASPQPHLRCLALYGVTKHFGYKGPYDPFESGDPLARGIADFRAAFGNP